VYCREGNKRHSAPGCADFNLARSIGLCSTTRTSWPKGSMSARIRATDSDLRAPSALKRNKSVQQDWLSDRKRLLHREPVVLLATAQQSGSTCRQGM